MKIELVIKSMGAGAAAAAVVVAAMAAGCVTSHKKEYIVHEVWSYSGTGQVTNHEVWSENHHGGGTALLADPVATQIASYHTNQTALGGASTFSVGNIQATVSTNAAAIISSGGTAVGNVIGAAVK
jgi:hypothetical protein